MNDRVTVLIEYLKALIQAQATGIKVRDEILKTIQKIEGEIKDERKQN